MFVPSVMVDISVTVACLYRAPSDALKICVITIGSALAPLGADRVMVEAGAASQDSREIDVTVTAFGASCFEALSVLVMVFGSAAAPLDAGKLIADGA